MKILFAAVLCFLLATFCSTLEYFYCVGGDNDGYSCQNLADVTTCGAGICVQDIYVDACGNGYRMGLEQCDDGNLVSGDGCSSNCTIEVGWECFGGSGSSKDSCQVHEFSAYFVIVIRSSKFTLGYFRLNRHIVSSIVAAHVNYG
jgi:cysteine-rich repeat protein